MRKIFAIFFILSLLSACKKDEKPQAPVISFKSGDNYSRVGSVVAVGRKLYFGIEARSTNENITNFYIQKVLKNGTIITVLDSGMNSSILNVNKTFFQNVEDTVIWTFTVMNRARLSSHITMEIYKDPNSQFGGIYYYPLIKMGYQNNLIYGHYLDPSIGKVYFSDTASLNQSKMDIICYQYITSGSPSPVLSSPGEMDNASTDAQTYYPEIVNWTARQYTKWDISTDNGTNAPLTASDFDNSQNDSLLIVSYHDVWGKKKFKFATTGKIIPFITAKGKKGLIKIINADNIDGSGMMEFALKIQQ